MIGVASAGFFLFVAAIATATAATWKWISSRSGQQQQQQAAPAAAVNVPAMEAPIEMQEVSGLDSNNQSIKHT